MKNSPLDGEWRSRWPLLSLNSRASSGIRKMNTGTPALAGRTWRCSVLDIIFGEVLEGAVKSVPSKQEEPSIKVAVALLLIALAAVLAVWFLT